MVAGIIDLPAAVTFPPAAALFLILPLLSTSVPAITATVNS